MPCPYVESKLFKMYEYSLKNESHTGLKANDDGILNLVLAVPLRDFLN